MTNSVSACRGLHNYPRLVADFLEGKTIFPVTLHVSPTTAPDASGRVALTINPGMLGNRLAEMAALGIRGLVFGAPGEPFLHQELSVMVGQVRAAGLDVGLVTNGLDLNPKVLEAVLPAVSFLRLAPAHEEIGDWHTPLAGLGDAGRLRADLRAHCRLIFRVALSSETLGQLLDHMVNLLEGGIDRLEVFPPTAPVGGQDADFAPVWDRLVREVRRAAGDSLVVEERLARGASGYSHCLALPFFACIDVSGDLYGCPLRRDDPRFVFGNLCENTFEDIWRGDRRVQTTAHCAKSLDPADCPPGCPLDGVNRWLWTLTHPGDHVNFI